MHLFLRKIYEKIIIEITKELHKILALIALQQYDNNAKSSYDNNRIFVKNTGDIIYCLLLPWAITDSSLTSYHVGKLIFQEVGVQFIPPLRNMYVKT